MVFALNGVWHDQAFDSILLDKHINTSLSDPHDNSLNHPRRKWLCFEELESVELDRSHACQLS